MNSSLLNKWKKVRIMKNKKDSYSKSTLFYKTLPYIKKEKKLFFLTVILAIVVAVLTTITPLITKVIID